MEILTNKLLLSLVERHEISLGSAVEQSAVASVNIHAVDGIYTTATGIPIHIHTSSCCDETGIECLLNHRHLPARGKRELLLVFEHVAELLRTLEERHAGLRFRIIVAVGDDEATVRFHKVRPGQEWIDVSKLESYQDEAVLVVTVGCPPDGLEPSEI